ncbi:Gfo/Idh/MocA family protein [Candidimonas nitroreducens]|uniref:4,5-dihydroxyphthalate dehydrogenase n=1 Tax=Candidimonas nitroreducens TaxID=683354 RepID=A0A225M0B5_9BURK|nr:Gfo/Idh/MocA family oxidoreductase [Candidimonas nitroreducens]OWT54824.1 4,5-dihydroxyphthalate dehydrogenase [Candidimonas nitroreducens]
MAGAPTPAPLKIGVIGLGRAFTLMLPTFLADARIALAAASDPRDAARRQFTADFGGPTYADAAELVQDASVEVVYIASPHQHHMRHTLQAAAAGKHVLLEKPMALSLADCDAMIAACRAAGVHLIVGHCHSFDTPYLRARDLVASGQFGRLTMIQAQNYTDYLYRPRRPEELVTAEGGGAVFSQAAHQVDIVRLLAGQRLERVRCALGNWDPARPTEGAYSALLWFEGGAYASISYNGYGHFNTDEWMGWIGEMGDSKNPSAYGAARRRLQAIESAQQEASLKAARTYGGPDYVSPGIAREPRLFQHFGPIIVSCEHGDIRPMPHGLEVYADERHTFLPLEASAVPRAEVIDELLGAVSGSRPPIHTGEWARGTTEACLAMLESHRTRQDVALRHT